MIDIKKAITTLAGNDVEFVIIGGVALGIHAAAYITYDIDICYSRTRENLQRIADALKPFAPRLRGFPKELPFIWDASTLLNGTNFTLDTALGDLDMLGEVSGIGVFDDVVRKSEKWNLYGYEVQILSVEGLISAKEAAGREKDQPGLKMLYAIRDLESDEEP
jgi:predicted nucleotidyltransferase